MARGRALADARRTPRRLARHVAALTLALVLGACGSTSRDAAPPAPSGGAPFLDADAIARRVHDRVNVARRTAGLAPLAWSAPLAEIGTAHSRDMARRAYFAHASPDGDRVDDRAAAAGLECRRRTGAVQRVGFGENLFRGGRYRSYRETTGPGGTVRTYDWKTADDLARETVDGWLASPPHRANLLDAGYRTEGIGIEIVGMDDVFVTQILC